MGYNCEAKKEQAKIPGKKTAGENLACFPTEQKSNFPRVKIVEIANAPDLPLIQFFSQPLSTFTNIRSFSHFIRTSPAHIRGRHGCHPQKTREWSHASSTTQALC